MDDLTTYVLLGTSFFFVALSFGLLVRYRQVSQKITSSTDMGHDLWQTLEQRLKKQDERILDMMGRMEVVQARVMSGPAVHIPSPPAPAPLPAPSVEGPAHVTEPSPVAQQPESQHKSQAPSPSRELDETQLAAIKLLSGSPKDTRELTDALKKSREHTARIMKELFELGLVRRNDSTKPFVYQLTDEGRRFLS